MIRKAVRNDPLAEMMADYLAENEKQGSTIAAGINSLAVYLRLATEYMSGASKGFVLVAEVDGDVVGFTMWGDSGSPFDCSVPEPIQDWGSYVVPSYRGRGLMRAMREVIEDASRKMGFQNVTGGVAVGNPLRKVMEPYRGAHTREIMVVLPLGGE